MVPRTPQAEKDPAQAQKLCARCRFTAGADGSVLAPPVVDGHVGCAQLLPWCPREDPVRGSRCLRGPFSRAHSRDGPAGGTGTELRQTLPRVPPKCPRGPSVRVLVTPASCQLSLPPGSFVAATCVCLPEVRASCPRRTSPRGRLWACVVGPEPEPFGYGGEPPMV